MKVGDLVKHSYELQGAYLVTEWRFNWIKVLGSDRWFRITDWEPVNESR